jgi:hypothetical protein
MHLPHFSLLAALLPNVRREPDPQKMLQLLHNFYVQNVPELIIHCDVLKISLAPSVREYGQSGTFLRHGGAFLRP